VVSKQRLDTAGAVVDTRATAHDAIGRPTRITRTAPGQDDSVLRFDYDGQLDGVTAPGQLGRMTHVRGDGWERSQLYDALGRVEREHIALTGWRELTRDKAYRADGSVASNTVTITDATGAVKFASTQETELDNLGRVNALAVDGSVLYTLSYDDEGRLHLGRRRAGRQRRRLDVQLRRGRSAPSRHPARPPDRVPLRRQ
jgi:hypothetical protein